MEENIVLKLTKEEVKLIEGCLLMTKETLKCLPFKTNDIKKKIVEIEQFWKKLN